MTQKTLKECCLIANTLENILTGKNPYYKDRAQTDHEFRNHVSMALAEERNLINRVTAVGA